MNITLCTGMMRSGSTWSFNVARLLMEQSAKQLNKKFFSSYDDYLSLDNFLQEHASTTSTFIVIKAHHPSNYALKLINEEQVKNICTIRDPRDCVASNQLLEDKDFDESFGFTKIHLEYIQHYLNTGSTLFVRYEEMMENPIRKIDVIAKYLNINAAEEIIKYIHQETNIEAAKKIIENIPSQPKEAVHEEQSHLVDNKTILHQDHIHGGKIGRWKNDLNQEQQKTVNQEFKEMLIKLGYETSESMKELLND